MQLAHSNEEQEVAQLLFEFPRLLVSSGGLENKAAQLCINFVIGSSIRFICELWNIFDVQYSK